MASVSGSKGAGGGGDSALAIVLVANQFMNSASKIRLCQCLSNLCFIAHVRTILPPPPPFFSPFPTNNSPKYSAYELRGNGRHYEAVR